MGGGWWVECELGVGGSVGGWVGGSGRVRGSQAGGASVRASERASEAMPCVRVARRPAQRGLAQPGAARRGLARRGLARRGGAPDDEPNEQPTPERTEAEAPWSERKPATQRHAHHPETDEVRPRDEGLLAQPAQHARRHSLVTVDHLEEGDGRRERAHPRSDLGVRCEDCRE